MIQAAYRPQSLLWVFVLATAIGSGCGDGGRFRVTGTVVFDDRPVPAGFIYFHPNRAAGNEGPSGFAQIVDGAFDTAKLQGQGAIAGSHEVVISGHEPATAPSKDNPEGGGKAIFGDFRQVIELPAAASRHDFVVPDEAAKDRGN